MYTIIRQRSIHHFLILMFMVLKMNQVSSEIIRFEVKEGLPINTLVGNLFKQLPSNILRHSNIKFSPMETKDWIYFNINKNNGDVTIAKEIDIETLDQCSNYRTACQLKLSANVLQDDSIEDILDIYILVLDTNDNVCQFRPSGKQVVTFNEDARVKEARVALNRPYDPDRQHSILENEIYLTGGPTGYLEKFKLNTLQTTATGMPFSLELALIGPLDYEQEKVYHFLVRASDGKLGHECILNLTVEVGNVNDNIPVFSSPEYTASVLENATLGSSIATVKATDLDADEHGRIIYELSPYADSVVRQTFGIRETTGVVYLKEKLNYAQRSSYNLPLIARNSVSSSRDGSTELRIKVIDVNDNRPFIQVFGRFGKSNVELEEEVSSSNDVASVTVKDLDSGLNGVVECQLFNKDSEQGSSAFVLSTVGSPGGGKYKVSKLNGIKFDRERQSVVNFTISCHDKGTPQLTANKDVMVTITDVNDHGPIFKQTQYDARVNEDNDPERADKGYFLLRVEATDKDVGLNGEIEYVIQAPDAIVTGLVKVNKKTGELSSSGHLDRERLEQFSFLVVAYDKGNPPRSATTTVNIVVKDINDHAPRFSEKSYNFEVVEETPVGTLVGILRASDQDAGMNSKLIFKIIQDASMSMTSDGSGALMSQYQQFNGVKKAQDLFQIVPRFDTVSNSYEVQLHTNARLDREAVMGQVMKSGRGDGTDDQGGNIYPVYVVQIVAEDMGNRQNLRHQVAVHVHLRDINDQTPRFTFPNGNNSLVPLSYLETPDYQFAQVTAVDQDAGENGTLVYSIVTSPGSPASKSDSSMLIAPYLRINARTGGIALMRSLTESLVGLHAMDIHVTDQGSPPRTNQARLYLRVDKSAPLGPLSMGGRRGGGLFSGDLSDSATNLYIIIAIVVASFVIAVVLLTAICIVLRRSRRQPTRFGDYKNTADYNVYPMGPPGGLPIGNYSSTLPPPMCGISGGTIRRGGSEITFRRAPSLDHIPLGPMKPPPYHPLPQTEDKRNSLASADRDSGNGDSLDVNPSSRYIHHGHLYQPNYGPATDHHLTGGAACFSNSASNYIPPHATLYSTGGSSGIQYSSSPSGYGVPANNSIYSPITSSGASCSMGSATPHFQMRTFLSNNSNSTHRLAATSPSTTMNGDMACGGEYSNTTAHLPPSADIASSGCSKISYTPLTYDPSRSAGSMAPSILNGSSTVITSLIDNGGTNTFRSTSSTMSSDAKKKNMDASFV